VHIAHPARSGAGRQDQAAARLLARAGNVGRVTGILLFAAAIAIVTVGISAATFSS
jgi:hypothetical protein